MTRRPALANLFDALPSNSSVVDATGRIVLVNNCWRAFADDNDLNDPTYCLGQSYYAVCEKAAAAGEATGAEMAAGLRDVIAGRRAIFRLTYPCAPPGQEAWYEATVTPVDGVRKAKALIQHVPATSRVVAEISSDRFRVMKETAEEKANARARLLATASHDLRQPLQAMSLHLAALRGHPLDPAASHLVAHVQEALDALSRLLNRLLDVSQLHTGSVPIHPGPAHLGAILERLSLDFGPAARAKGLELRVVPCSVVVFSDAVLLQRILANLVSNAIRYTAAGRVLVGALRRGQRVRIRVCDTGAGIPEAELANIFDEFYRLDQGDLEEHGYGLGLAIVKQTADLLGHEVSAWSRPGKGSCFDVRVVLAEFGQ
ncbi:MAG: HAMP domain-containing histidine kinase [Rhodospirillales bacterium]|nr:HAMP domain-containing histidine kinase [Rhodospirillales bacterium]